ncbi:carbohydrate porin [Endozoicomonas arenosclerae]|uniref:carbohydrate porin n=1 Tax=Endozoicomonas arenosclerae TaxID=1633495 RepID=UPI0007840D48|nr:carbohydrate porin [Endozoicomonas arenosclerae]
MKKILTASAALLATAAVHGDWTSEDGSLTIGGNAEINTDYVDVDKAKIHPKDTGVNDGGKIADDSRFLLDVQWITRRGEKDYITAKAQPLIRTDGTVAIDDSYLALGQEKIWEFQIGRYEAMELFSVGKDTVAYIAAGADTMGQGVYYYKGHEGRGRRDKMGQARLAGETSNWDIELSTAYGDAADMLAGSNDYLKAHNLQGEFKSDDNSFVLRPAVRYTSDSGFFNVSLGAEFDVSRDKVHIMVVKGDTDETRKELAEYDLSERVGGAIRTEFMITEDLPLRLSGAYQKLKDIWKVYHFNANFEYKQFGLGLSLVKNDFDNKTLEDTSSYVLYTAYTLPIMDFDNATLTLGASYSETDNAYGYKDNKEKTGAVRARINYYF